MTVAQLLAEHRRILVAVARLEALVAAPRPERVDRLSEKRWTFTRDLLLHFTHVELLVHAPLLADRRPQAAPAVVVSRDQTVRLVGDFRDHAARWYGLPAPAEWDEYALVINHMMGRIRGRLASQERSLYPLLPAQPDREAPVPRTINYAADAWKIRQLIYGEDGAPIEDQLDASAPWPALPAFATADISVAARGA